MPIRHSQHLPGKVEFGVYESGPRKSVFPPRAELRRGDSKTDSTSSTASEQADRPELAAPSQLDSSWLSLWALETCCYESSTSQLEPDLGLGGDGEMGNL